MIATFKIQVPPQDEGQARRGEKPDAVEYIEIGDPGGKDIVFRRATDADRQRYRSAYAAFKAPQRVIVPAAPAQKPEPAKIEIKKAGKK